MDLITIFIILSIGQGIFLGFVLLTIKRGNISANRLLGLLLLFFAFGISGFVFVRSDTYKDVPFLIGVPSTVIFLYGPLFYFYVKKLTHKKIKLKFPQFLHFIPFILLVIYRLPFYLSSNSNKIASLNNSSAFGENLIILSLQIVHVFIYLFFTMKLLTEYERRIKSTMSSLDKINLRWIKFGNYAFLIVFGLMTVFVAVSFFGIDLYQHYITVIPILVSIVILTIGYFGLTQPIIITNENNDEKIKKYEKSSLTLEKADSYLEKLLRIMESEKPFLNSNLTLQKLAETISMQPHHLSQIINERMHQNFFDFVNNYRIEEAKKLLTEPRSELLTILAIAEEVGFNSKSSFNVAFKKCTSMTPSQFRQNHSS